MIDLAMILIVIIGIIAVIDWKFKQIPSIFLTGILFVVMMIQLFTPSTWAYFHLAGGLTFLVFAWMLYEADFIGGIADIKIITVIGLMISNYPFLFIGVLLILLYGFVYKVIFRYVLKKDKNEDVAFIPCLFSVYLVLYFTGGVL